MNPEFKMLLGAVSALLLNGCSAITPINHLALPPVTSIEGTVTQVNKNGFYLKDLSGSIFVRAKLPSEKSLPIIPGENIRVCGNLQGGEENIFDGYVIVNAAGRKIIISRPTPHFGFIIQTAFE